MALELSDQRLRVAPESPGVYLMKDVRGTVLYVGKASVLRNRLRTYFGSPSNLPNKIRRMLDQLDDFECIVTDSEAEALILENTLIKRYRPRYNARLKDDKTYPFLKIDLKEEFPRVYITRRVARDGARYFGPFATAGTVRKTMDLIKKLFPYRSCTKQITGTDPRPCLEYYINRCVAPCTGNATKEEYGRVVPAGHPIHGREHRCGYPRPATETCNCRRTVWSSSAPRCSATGFGASSALPRSNA